jgi:hypothetical protein
MKWLFLIGLFCCNSLWAFEVKPVKQKANHKQQLRFKVKQWIEPDVFCTDSEDVSETGHQKLVIALSVNFGESVFNKDDSVFYLNDCIAKPFRYSRQFLYFICVLRI